MIKNLLFIFLGGGLGSIFRFGIAQLNHQYPYGTLLVNLVGALLMGIFLGLFKREIFTDIYYLSLAVGFCGGFTTFSSLAAENYKLLQIGDYMGFVIYTLVSIFVGIAMVALGFKISQLV